MKKWKIVAITDTHCQHEALDGLLPDGDVIIHAGDATYRGTYNEVIPFLEWYGNLPYAYKIFVAGNHDWLFEKERALARLFCRENDIIYLEDEAITLKVKGKRKIRIYGTPHVPVFFNWAFNREEQDLYDIYTMVPENLDILITHGPPYGVLDEVNEDFKTRYCGCYQLRDAVADKKPKFHVFGHIHEGYGTKRLADTTFINACTCDRNYKPVNPPIVFEIN